MPCRTRPAIITSRFGANAQMTEATANQITPMTNVFRRPNLSPSDPLSRISDASISM
jgi:hypothetical protein